jgi:HAD superfamily phosphoserine phosphatase-like hydrolase
MSRELSIFDFCETTVDLQTADDFLSKLLMNNNVRLPMSGVSQKIISYITRGNINRKKRLVHKTRGVRSEELDAYVLEYGEWLKGRTNQRIIEIMKSEIMKDRCIVVISGGFHEYIEAYFNEMGLKIDLIIANRLSIDEGYLTGRMIRKDCLGFEKIIRLKEVLTSLGVTLKNSRCYTDHISDLPILNIVAEGFVIRKNSALKWDVENKFTEILV